MSTWTLDHFARLIDHTNLHADATEADMRTLCDEAKHHHFKMVAINQVQARFCAQELAGTDIDTGAAIAFPLGQTSIAAKVFETRDALANGANEIDYVVNVTRVNAEIVKSESDFVVNNLAHKLGLGVLAHQTCHVPMRTQRHSICQNLPGKRFHRSRDDPRQR